MAVSFRRRLLQSVNQALALGGVELVRVGKEFQDYIPLKQTLADAEKAVCRWGIILISVLMSLVRRRRRSIKWLNWASLRMA